MTPCWFYKVALLGVLPNCRAPLGNTKEALGHSLSCETRCLEELERKHDLHQQSHILLSMSARPNNCLCQLFSFSLVLFWVWLLLQPWANLFALGYFISFRNTERCAGAPKVWLITSKSVWQTCVPMSIIQTRFSHSVALVHCLKCCLHC